MGMRFVVLDLNEERDMGVWTSREWGKDDEIGLDGTYAVVGEANDLTDIIHQLELKRSIEDK
jgi:hypothetical protein